MLAAEEIRVLGYVMREPDLRDLLHFVRATGPDPDFRASMQQELQRLNNWIDRIVFHRLAIELVPVLCLAFDEVLTMFHVCQSAVEVEDV